MREKDESVAERIERWFVTMRIETHGTRSPGPRGSSRRLSRALSEAEVAALNERLRAAAEGFLAEIGALEGEGGEGWAEALADGAWGWRIEG
jgi:hypothetical protein